MTEPQRGCGRQRQALGVGSPLPPWVLGSKSGCWGCAAIAVTGGASSPAIFFGSYSSSNSSRLHVPRVASASSAQLVLTEGAQVVSRLSQQFPTVSRFSRQEMSPRPAWAM